MKYRKNSFWYWTGCYLLLSFIISGCGTTKIYKIKEESKEKAQAVKIEAPKSRLRVGEKLTYKAEWMGMDVGRATLLVKEITKLNGHEVYHIRAEADTTSFVAKLFPVQDEIATYIDTKELYPVRFDKKQKEGKRHKDEYIDFDQKEGKAFYTSRLTNEKKEFKVPGKVQDPVSCIYYFRLSDVKEGEALFANVHLDDKNWFLETRIINRGIVKIKGLGNYQAFMAEPLSWFQGELNKNAKVSIWFSADQQRIPLLIVVQSSIPLVGTVTITLQKIE